MKTPEFEWDEHNLRRIKRHNVEAEEAEQALANDPLELEPWYLESEERFPPVGPTNAGRWLIVVTPFRGQRVRVVTAFDASKRLIEMYFNEKRGL